MKRTTQSGARTLSEFKGQFLGGARPHLWKMEMTFPTGATGTSTTVSSGVGSSVSILNSSEKFCFDVESISIPSMELEKVEAAFMGRKIKYAGDRKDYDAITVKVKNDRDWSVRTSFEQWMAYMNGQSENVGANSLAQYARDIDIIQLDREANAIAVYTLIDAFPSKVGQIELTYEEGNKIEKFDVSFEYQWWTRESAGIV